MPLNDSYRRQVFLLIRILPFVAGESCFALKGGTAINLFFRNLPRLSIDIDLTYLPLHPRDEALTGIDSALKRIGAAISITFPEARIEPKRPDREVFRLFIELDRVRIKIEVSPVLRGVVNEVECRAVSEAAEREFGFAETQVVSFADLYAGKLVAALDRQHPRDLYDVAALLANEGLTAELREAFIVYLLSHNRPMGEVLACRQKDITSEFRNGFEGMTIEPVTLDKLIETRTQVVDMLVKQMPERHKRFLVSFEAGSPDWLLLNIPHADRLPAVAWRQVNLETRTTDQRKALVDSLQAALF